MCLYSFYCCIKHFVYVVITIEYAFFEKGNKTQMRSFLGFSLCVMLAACSNPNKDVKFSPVQGEERGYQAVSRTHISIDTGRGKQQMSSTSQQLARYKVVQTGKETKLELYIDYLNMRDGQSGLRSSRRASANPELHALFSKGFSLTAGLEAGKLTHFAALNDEVWQALLKNRGTELEAELKKMFSAATFITTVPAKVGATVTLPGYQDLTDVTLTVLALTDEQLTAQLAAELDDGKLYGQLVLSRQSGWLEKMLMVADLPFEQYGYAGRVRSQVVMVPDSEMYGSLFQQLEYNYQRPVYEYTTPPELASVTTMQPLTRQQVFPWPQGYFVLNDDLLGVNYQHDFSAGQQGRLKLTAISAQNSAGEPIPLQLRSQRLYTYANDDRFVKSSQQNLLVGWNEPDELMNDVAQLSAEAGFYPAELITLRIKPDPANTVTVSEGELTVTLSPVPDEPQTYKLTASGNERYQLLQRYDGAEGAMISYPGAQFSGPDWLTEDERNALDLVMAPYYNDAQNVTIFQFKQLPAELTLYASVYADKPLYRQNIQFLPHDKYPQADTLPPTNQYLLFDEDRFGQYAADDELSPPPVPQNPADVKPEPVNNFGLAVHLSAELAQLCTLTVNEAPQVSGQALQWQLVPQSPRQALPKQVKYQLSTTDGIRRYFYDIDVTTSLSCKGTPHWQRLDYTPEVSWLVDLNKLPEWEPGWTMATLLQRYRFLNHEGLALSPVQSGWSYDLSEQQLSTQLHNEHYLRIQGRVTQIQHLTQQGEPVTDDWSYRFPALP